MSDRGESVPDDAIDPIIERSLRGEAGEPELAALAAWRRQSLYNEQRYSELVRLLDFARSLSHVKGGAVPSAASVLVAGASAARDARSGSHWKAWGVAAAAVILFAAGIAVLTRQRGNAFWGPVDVVTGVSEMTTVQLRDGSVVRLAPASRIRFAASATVRELTLTGRAYFAVARSPGRPFVVRTRLGDAQVLGTRFELAAERDSLRLLVVEGRVALSAAGERVEVRAGQQSGARGGAPLPPTFVADSARMHEWVGKFLVFQATAMPDVVREINETYGLRLDVADSMIARRTVTATFMDWRGDQVVDVICSIVGARCEWRAGVVTMTSSSPAGAR